MQIAERRRSRRVPVKLPATLLILIPEAPVYPALHDVTIVDLSEQGAMIHLNLPDHAYQAIRTRNHYFPTGFKNCPDLPNVVGRTAWIRPVHSNGKTEYNIGLYFEECPRPITDRLRRFLDKRIEDIVATVGDC